MVEQAVERLHNWCQAVKLPWHERAAEQFGHYISLLMHAQSQTNLTGFSTPLAIVEELFIDSLQILRVKKPVVSLLDVGTGAGLPGIPIKILCPEIETILVEPRTKRYAFLRLAERELGLGKIEIHKCRIESLDLKNAPEMAISKAFAPIPEWLALSQKWATQGTAIACLVSQKDWESVDVAQFGYQTTAMLNENKRVYAIVRFV